MPLPANPLDPESVTPERLTSSPEASAAVSAYGDAKSSAQGFRCALLPAVVIAAARASGGQQRSKGWRRRAKALIGMRGPREGAKTTSSPRDR